MSILKQIKTLQHVSIIIREFIGSLLKSLNLKFYCQLLNVVMWQHNVWYKCVMFRHALIPNVMLPHHHNQQLTIKF